MSIEYAKSKIEFYQNFPIEGVEYIDLNPVYKDPKARDIIVDKCIDLIKDIDFDYLALIESRGFLIGSILADKLSKGIILLRSKKDRLPGKIQTVRHKLEYGEAIMQVQEGNGNVLIFDDVLATGGTANGAFKVLNKGGYNPVFSLFLVELSQFDVKCDTNHKSAIVL
ncbi:MAG: adenine phosphoribosyltransferase [Bacteroidota bacterium]|jgi:adenine phosphoribosyltransferase|nr:adenine phosphoribosyltransferase [Bacteroidota bacterium]